MNKFLLLLLLPFGLYPMDPSRLLAKSPQEIQRELDKAEADFEYAKGLFAPYYTGPLITPSGSMMPPGEAMDQAYIFVVDNYAAFNKDRKSVSLPSDLVQLNIQPIVFQFGITPSVDMTVVFGQLMNWQHSQFGGGIQDVAVTAGFLIYNQTLYVPQFKFVVTQSFPTGKYQNLSFNGYGLNATGAGAYKTTFGFATNKLLLWDTYHPLNTRAFFGYTIATPIKVDSFNAYGGGHGTKGVVHPGNGLTADVGLELSITQKWVVALDVVYTSNNRTKFTGYPGKLADGTPASVGGHSNDNLSLAPAFEYNWSEKGGVIAGAWFSVYGRNSLNFVQGVVSAYIMFP